MQFLNNQTAGHGVTIYDASKQHVHGIFHICPSIGDISCVRNEPKQCINTGQITEVSNSVKRNADNSGNHANTSEATKALRDRKENSKCTNVMNRRSREG